MAFADDINTTIAGYAAMLASDSASPQPSYSINGKSVSRTEWRSNLVKTMNELMLIVNQLNPYWVSTKQVL